MSEQVQETEQQAEETVVEETTPSTEEAVAEEQPQEESADTTEESEETTEEQTEQAEEAPKEDEFVIKGKVGDEEITYDLRNPDQRTKLIEDAQKGIGFTKKSQALSEWQTANEPLLNFAQTVMADETMQKAIVAKQLGIDPSVAFQKTAPPDEYWKEANPEAYYQALYQHKQAVQDQQRLDLGLKQYKETISNSYNNALLEKSKVKNDLSDTQAKEIARYVTENMRSNQMGMYSEKQIDDAVKALYGDEKMKKEKLNQSEKFNKTIKTIAKGGGTAKATKAPDPKKLSPEEAESKKFKDYVKSVSR